MAIYHCSAKIVSRGKGQSVLAKAAYNARESLQDERYGQTHDYSAHGGRVFEGLFVPANAPGWMKDRQQLWQGVEARESRRDAQLAREIEISLPHELTDQQREWLVKDYVREAFVRKGMVADVCLHAPNGRGDERNHHAHILLTLREVGPEGFGPKVREWNSDEQLKQWRSQWERLANRYLERFGHEARIDARSLEAQGLDQEPTIHLGPQVAAAQARGQSTDRGERLQEIAARNAERKRLHGNLEQVTQEITQETLQAEARAAEEARQQALARQAQEAAKREAARVEKERAAREQAYRQAELMRERERREAEQARERERREAERQREAEHAKARAQKEQEAARRGANDNQRFPSPSQVMSRTAQATERAASGGLRVASTVAGKGASRLVDMVDGLLNVFVAPAPRQPSVAEFLNNREARRAQYQQIGAERQREEALDRLAEDMRAGRHLSAADVRQLNQHDLFSIKQQGDDYLKQLIEQRERERRWGNEGRERER